ncbi:MAG: DUF4410 domain-containing protein [Bdellovibrionota bacterium]
MNFKSVLLCLALGACAHGKMGVVDQDLSAGAIPAGATISIEPVSAADAKFSGDKSGVAQRVNDEKIEIKDRYNRMIAEQLKKKGFNAQATLVPAKSGLALKGKVSKFEHGSAAARILVGMGAGSSDLYTDFELVDVDSQKRLAKFEIIATSGGSGGMQAAGSYMSAHLENGSEKVAEYLTQKNNPNAK